MELTNLQKEKVDELLSLYNPNKKVKIDFKAPTGSGKTLMATAFMAELMAQNVTDKFVFVIATPSSSDLPYSFEQKILQYKNDLSFSNFAVEYIKSPSETGQNGMKTDGTIRIIPEANKVYIFGKSSFGKDRILTTRHIIDDFVDMVKNNDFKLIYIRDEAHIGGRLSKDENFESLMQNNADLIIKMTATPNFKDQTINKVILTEEDLNNPIKNEEKYLLKTTAITLLNGEMDDNAMIDDAIKKFKQIKEEYKKLERDDIYIHPALLVQVDNSSNIDNEKRQKFENTLKMIKDKFSYNGIKYAQYFGKSKNDKDSNTIYKENFDLNEISENKSDFDAVIFKIGPATGWDIPRACMLLQLRNVCSEGLNIQTIGRIKRNCYAGLQKNEVTDKYYIYSNAPKDNNLIIFNAKVKEEFKNEEFMSIEIKDEKQTIKKVAEQNLTNDINDFLYKNKEKILQLSQYIFKYDGNELYYRDIYVSAVGGEYVVKISNVFQFIKMYKKLKLKNEEIFKNCEKIFYQFWKDNFKMIKFYKKFNFTKEMFYITIIKKFENDINNLINKNRQYKPHFEVVSKCYDPQAYTIIYTNVAKEEKVRMKSYLFKTDINGKENYQPIGENDDSPEVFVFNKISDIDDDEKCINVWAKNFTTSKVNGAYIDKYNNIKHSYFDFIIKFKNNALLYIEVKGEKDIDTDKTETLKGAYKKYFDDMGNGKSIFDKPVVISIFKVNTRKREVSHTSFYDKRFFDESLNTLSVEDLIKKIAGLRNYTA